MARNGRLLAAGTVASLLSLSMILLSGCSQDNSGGGQASGGPPPNLSGGSGGPTRGPGGDGGGAPIAANVPVTEIMEKSCKCHGPGGKGGNAPVIAGSAKTEEELVKIITDGKGKMPAFKGKLTDEQIKNTAAELKKMS
jgi:hypothetical protein